MSCMWGSEDNLQELVLFHRVDLRYQTQGNRLGHKYVSPTELSYWPFPCFKISELNTHCVRCGALTQIEVHFLLSQRRARGTQTPPVSARQSVVGTFSSPRLLPLSQQSYGREVICDISFPDQDNETQRGRSLQTRWSRSLQQGGRSCGNKAQVKSSARVK